MLISELTATVIVAIVITILAAVVGVFLLQRQSRLKDPLIDTGFLKYIGDEKEQGMLPSWIPLYGSPLRVGRYDNFEIQLDDIRVSRFHALIVFDTENKRFLIRDQGSTGGTFINGRQLGPTEVMELRENDNVAFGPILYKFTDEIPKGASSDTPTDNNFV